MIICASDVVRGTVIWAFFFRRSLAAFRTSTRSCFAARISTGAVVFKCLMCVGLWLGTKIVGLVVGMSHGVASLGTILSNPPILVLRIAFD